MKFKNVDLFSPYILVVIIAIYSLLAAVAYQQHIRNLQWISSITLIYVLLGTLFFIAGVFLPKWICNHNIRLKSLFKTPRISNAAPWYNKLKILLDERVLLALILFSLFLQAWNLYLIGGIPLFNGYLKFKATTDLWRLSYLIFLPTLNLLVAKYPRKWYSIIFIIGLGLFAVTGYRTTTIAIILSVFITLYYSRKLNTIYILLFIVLIAIIGIIVGYIAVKSIQWQQWALNPLELLCYRAGFTLMVFDKIVHMAGTTTGEIFKQVISSGHPRVTVGQVVLGYPAVSGNPTTSITSTIFGPAVLDFGFWAMALQMFILGIALRVVHIVQYKTNGAFTALYAIILAHTMIWVETGPTDFIVWIFYLLAIFAVIIYISQLRRENSSFQF
jgi:oligosaccharide repeat unit polymerase